MAGTLFKRDVELQRARSGKTGSNREKAVGTIIRDTTVLS